jgi:NAD(P)-dependent dehydrogenase (short-subunit alcohol dehydrogenase family)
MLMEVSLHNKNMEREFVLVTGASSGMGEEIAKSLSSEYNIILNGRDRERLESVENKCHGDKNIIWQYDLSDVEGLESSLQELLKENDIKVSYFVHCAGYMKMYPVKMLTPKLFTDAFNVNVISAAMIVKNLASKKVNEKSLRSAVFISSNISNFGAKAFSVYSSSKAAIDGLMRSLAIELAPSVRINSVLPGGVRTRMTESIYQNEEVVSRMVSTYPLGLGDVTEIRDAVLFLLSDKARWITGQQLTVDGGRTVNITG